MQDSVGRPKDLFVDKKGLPLAFYLPPQCIDETDALQDDLATHGGSLCRSMQDAHIILVDPTRLAALNDVQSHQVVLNKTWLKLCLVANSILDADTNWANQVLTKHMDNSQFQKTGRPPLKITTSMDKLTLPSIRDLGLLKGNPLTHPSPIRRPGTLCNQIPAVSRSSRYSTPDDPSDRPATRDVYSDHSPRYTSSRLYDPPSGHAQDNRVRSTGKHEESRRQNWGYPSSPLYRRPYRYAAPDRPPQGHRGYADTDYERDGSIGFEYSSARREYDRAPEDPRRIAPPRYPSRYPDPIREDKYFGGVFERPSEELYYPPQSRDDRFSPPNKHSPRSYAYTMSEDYTRASPGPPSYSSSSPEDRGYPATPEKRSDLRVVQYDPNRFDPFERPAQRVYRGGYPVESKAAGMTEPTYTMPDGRTWTIDDDEPPPTPHAPPRNEGSKRHNQYSEAEDWFIVHYSNWIMQKQPKIEMKELYKLINEKMEHHTPLALYLRVNKSRDYFRRLGMTEKALSRRVQTASGRKKKDLEEELMALDRMSLRDSS